MEWMPHMTSLLHSGRWVRPLGGGSKTVAVNVALNHSWDGSSDSWTLSGDDIGTSNTINTAQNLQSVAPVETSSRWAEALAT